MGGDAMLDIICVMFDIPFSECTGIPVHFRGF